MDTPLVMQHLGTAERQLRVAVVTETYPPEVNGVAMTTGRLVDGMLRLGHQVQLVRPRQGHGDQPASADGLEEVLSRGLPIPRYNHLKLGLPARNVLQRLWSLRRPDVVQVVTEGPLGWSAVAAARKLPGCNGRAGTMGYCLGGRLAFMMAEQSDADVNISYYGVGLDGLIGGRDFIAGPTLTLADILLFCTMDFAATVGQPVNRDNKNIAAWYDRVKARPSAAASAA